MSASPVPPPPLLDIWTVMDCFGVSRSTVNRMTKAGLVSAIKIGGLVRFPAEDVYRVMADGSPVARLAPRTTHHGTP